MTMEIRNTKSETLQPWGEDLLDIQGSQGSSGVWKGKPYFHQAFVEVCVGETFIRADADTLGEAEALAYQKYQRYLTCAAEGVGHEYETRDYTNGAGFCKKCKMFKSHAFTGADLGQFCAVCGDGTTYSSYTDKAYWDENFWGDGTGWPRDPGKKGDLTLKWYCENDTLFQKEREVSREHIHEVFSAKDIEETLTLVVDALSKMPEDSQIDSPEETASLVTKRALNTDK